MVTNRFKGAALAAALGIAAAVPGPAAAEGDWLTALSGPLTEAGYRVAWKRMSIDPGQGRVSAHGLTGSDAAGRIVLRIGAVSVDRPRSGPGGTLLADRLILDQVETPGAVTTAIARVVVTRPDLRSVAGLLATAATPRPGERAPGEHAPGTVRPVAIEQLELSDLRQEWTQADGERITSSVGTLRATGLRIDPSGFAVAGDPDRLRPLSALAAVQVELLSARDIRVRSSASGTTEIAHQWIRSGAGVPGRSGSLRYGIEGVRTRPDDAMAPFAASLFPPDGEVPTQWTGDVAYDVDGGLLDYRQRILIDGFGALDVRGDLRELPDLSIAEWDTVGNDDPRLVATRVEGLAVTLTDTGGVDRIVSTLATDGGAPSAERRAAAAGQLDALGQALNPTRDPRLQGWLRAVQEFVRLGGTLALAATRPIPVNAAGDHLSGPEELSALAARYGLEVTRR